MKQIIHWLWSMTLGKKPLAEQVEAALDLLGVNDWARQDRYDALVVYVVHGIEEMMSEAEEK